MIWLWSVLIVLVLLFGWTALIGAPYVPSRKRNVRVALTELYRLKKNDLLADLGSGDGLVLREASSLGARAVGYEMNPILFLISKLITRNDHRVKVTFSNYWSIELPKEATVVYIFGVGRDMKGLKKWMQRQSKRLSKNLFLISLGFEIYDMKPIKTKGPYYLYKF